MAAYQAWNDSARKPFSSLKICHAKAFMYKFGSTKGERPPVDFDGSSNIMFLSWRLATLCPTSWEMRPRQTGDLHQQSVGGWPHDAATDSDSAEQGGGGSFAQRGPTELRGTVFQGGSVNRDPCLFGEWNQMYMRLVQELCDILWTWIRSFRMHVACGSCMHMM